MDESRKEGIGMPHYRAVMATTIDCSGCKYDGDECTSEEGCIAFGQLEEIREKKKKDKTPEERIREILKWSTT